MCINFGSRVKYITPFAKILQNDRGFVIVLGALYRKRR